MLLGEQRCRRVAAW